MLFQKFIKLLKPDKLVEICEFSKTELTSMINLGRVDKDDESFY